jgi:hypothetical protein
MMNEFLAVDFMGIPFECIPAAASGKRLDMHNDERIPIWESLLSAYLPLVSRCRGERFFSCLLQIGVNT